MVDAPVRIAQIGLGRFGRGHHLRNLLELAPGRVHIAAVCDRDPARGNEVAATVAAADRPAPQRYTEASELLAGGNLDGVVVSTVNHTHAPICRQALELGIPVLVDKPLTMTVPEAEGLVALSRARDVPLVTAFTRHFLGAVERPRQRIAGGDVGQLPVVTAIQRGHRPDAHPEDGGLLHRRSVHIFDVIGWLTGQPVTRVEARVTRDDAGESVVDARLQLTDGTVGHYLGIRDGVDNQDEVNIYGTQESYRIQRRQLWAGQARGPWAEVDDLPDAGGTVTGWFVDLLAGQLGDDQRQRADLHAADGLASMRVLEAVLESGRRGGAPVDVPH